MAGGFKKQSGKFLKIFFVLLLSSLFLWGCSSAPGKSKKRKQGSASRHKRLVKKKRHRGTAPSASKSAPKNEDPLGLSGMPTQWILPTIVNEADRSVMALIPSGEYFIGPINKLDPSLTRQVKLPSFYIDRAEISVEQFKKYDTSYNERVFFNGKKCPNCPAMGIPWMTAQSYCRWAGKRLPTEEEWEAGARGGGDFKWPWGSIYQTGKANLLGDDDGFAAAAPVGSFPASPLGVWDMAGNVWEWVAAPYPPKPASGKDGKLTAQIAKGGGWSSGKESALVSNRNPMRPDIRNPTVGFRCVLPAS